MMRKSTTVTLKDVAREAGVAKMTASFVLNGGRSGTRVSETTRARIVEAAQRLGYRRNAVARGLTRNRMDTIGVVAVIHGGLNLYFLELFNGILDQAILRQQSVTVLPIIPWGKDAESQLIEYCDGRVDGMILLGPSSMDAEFLASLNIHTPLVTINADELVPTIADVDVDDEVGCYLAAQHLIQQGHRRIAHLAGEEGTRSAELREAGYRRALTENGITIDPGLILGPGSYTEDSGRQRLAQFLETMEQWEPSLRPTALCCCNDATAIGCLKELTERGWRVPEQISLTGFDDVLSTQMTAPPLTTLKQPFQTMGMHALRLLLEEIDCRLAGTIREEGAKHEVLPAELIVRGSTAPPLHS